MKSTKLVVLSILLAVLAIPAFADDDAVAEKSEKQEVKTIDPSGTWRWESDRNGENVKHQLKLDANKKNEVSGTYYGMIDGLESTKGEIKGDQLVLEFNVERDGLAFKAKYEATISDDNATGTLYFESDQGSGDMPWEAKRSLEMSDVAGVWEMELESPEGEIHEPTLTIVKKGDEYAGTWDGKEIGEFPIKEMTTKDGKFMFTVTGEIEGNEFVGKCVAMPKGSKFKGNMELEIGGNTMELPLAGKLKKDTEKKS